MFSGAAGGPGDPSTVTRVSVRHCPNPKCPYRAEHGRPAEYRDDASTCSDCGAELADGKGCFDTEDLRSARPLEELGEQLDTEIDALGDASGDPILLQKAPGSISLPTIQLVSGALVIAVSFYYLEQRHFVAVIPALVGFILFFLGFNRIKHRDRRARRVRLHQKGFAFHIGEKEIAVPFEEIEMAGIGQRALRSKGVTLGVLHDLLLSCCGGVYSLSSFESHAGLQPRETDRFVLWARNVVARAKKQAL